MFDELKQMFDQRRLKQLSDIRNIGLIVFTILVLAITWSSIKTLQANYELQKKIAVMKQQNTVLQLQNQNTELQNRYLQTDQYQDLAARQSLGLAAPGEKVLLVPKEIALKHVDPTLGPEQHEPDNEVNDSRSRYVKNIETWRDFLLGRQVLVD